MTVHTLAVLVACLFILNFGLILGDSTKKKEIEWTTPKVMKVITGVALEVFLIWLLLEIL